MKVTIDGHNQISKTLQGLGDKQKCSGKEVRCLFHSSFALHNYYALVSVCNISTGLQVHPKKMSTIIKIIVHTSAKGFK